MLFALDLILLGLTILSFRRYQYTFNRSWHTAYQVLRIAAADCFEFSILVLLSAFMVLSSLVITLFFLLIFFTTVILMFLW